MKKNLCLFLTACMLCSVLAACTGTPDEPYTGITNAETETSGEQSNPETDRTEENPENTSAPDVQETEPVEITTQQPDESTTTEPDETTADTETGNKPEAIVITFNYNTDDIENVIVTDPEGGVVTLPEVGSRRGYSFGGWYRDRGFAIKAVDGETVTASRTYYARWIYIGEQFQITYSLDGQIIETVYIGQMGELTLRGYLSEDQTTVLDVWEDEEGNTYQAGATIVVERDMALVAKLATASSISFDADGGTGTLPETNYYPRNTYITLPTASLVKGGETFVGWQDNYGTFYSAGERYNVTSSMTFTALYTGNKKVTFDFAGGHGTDMSGTYQYQETITLPTAPEREGYTFMAWYDGKLEYIAGATYMVGPADTVITAIWVEDATVVFHMNFDGVEDVYRTVKVSVNGTLDSFGDEPELRDHRFVGWYKEADLQRQAYINDVITGETHYYAKWEHTYFIFTPTPDETGYYLSCESFRTINYDDVRASEAFDPQTGIITLPSEYNGLPVVSLLPVDPGDFSPIFGLFNAHFNAPCKGVVIPKEWTVLPDSAFDFCQTLETVIFEDINAVTEFGEKTFYNCLVLTDFTFPPNLEKIGDACFLYSGINKVDLRNTKITEIPNMAFMRCFNLNELYLPENLVSIGDFAFQNTYNLPTVTLPDTLESIGGWAFSNAIGVNSVEEDWINGKDGRSGADIPRYNETKAENNYEKVEYFSILSSIEIPESVTTLGIGAFALCENIQTITFKGESKLTELRNYVFYGTAITSIDIPESVTNIGSGVFKECTQLTSISIPKNVRNLGYKAFGNATSLSDVTFAPDGVLDLNYFYTFSGCTGLTEITLPASVKEIGDFTFVNCTNLQKVHFAEGSQLLIVGNYAFAQSGLTEVVLPNTVKIVMEGAYQGLEKLVELVVPASLNSGT